MALSPDKAVTAVRDTLLGARAAESERLERIHAAMQPCGPTTWPNVEIPQDAPDALKRLARKSETNVLPLVVDTFSQTMKVDGYYTPGVADYAGPWEWWQRNAMDARQTGVHRAALTYGVSYVKVVPGTSGPAMSGASPRYMTALYQSPADDDWPMLALHVQGDRITLYDEQWAYMFGMEYARPAWEPAAAYTVPYNGRDLVYLETREHGVGVCPVVRFRDRMLLEGEEQLGLVEPLLQLQARIHETTFGMMVAQFFAAFKQRYVIGWVPDSEAEEMKAAASDAWYFDDPDVKVGQFQETDLTRYIDSKKSAFRDLAAIGQIPAQNLGVDAISNISDATLAGLETAKERKASEIETSFGESWEQALRLAAHIDGDAAAAADYQGEVKWQESTARSFAQTVDGLGKLASMLNVPVELLWEDVPGWTQQKVQRAKDLLRQGDALGSLTQLLEQQAAAETPPPAAAPPAEGA
jgi:hypothetical protein